MCHGFHKILSGTTAINTDDRKCFLSKNLHIMMIFEGSRDTGCVCMDPIKIKKSLSIEINRWNPIQISLSHF